MKVIVATCHCTRLIPYEQTVQLLSKNGFDRILIVNTTTFDENVYQGPRVWRNEVYMTTSFNAGLTRIAHHLRDEDFDYLLLLDNDCFIWSVNAVTDFLEAFQKGGFDFSSHLETPGQSIPVGCITSNYGYVDLWPVDQKVEPIQEYPFVKTTPKWENALALFSRRAILSLLDDELEDFRRLVAGISNRGFKMAVKVAQYKHKYSHHGKGWFHPGNLCPYIGAMSLYGQDIFPEALQSQEMREVVMARIGYTVWEGLRYGNDHRTEKFIHTRDLAASYFGGNMECLKAWMELTGTSGLSEGFDFKDGGWG